MAKYARIESGIIAEMIEPVERINLERRFPPDFVAAFVECDDDVQCRWLYDQDVFSPLEPILGDLASTKSALKQASGSQNRALEPYNGWHGSGHDLSGKGQPSSKLHVKI